MRTPPTDCESMGLTPGCTYDRSRLRLVGWRNEAGTVDGDAVAGYLDAHYWDADGRYLGPDQHGIEPVFARRDM